MSDKIYITGHKSPDLDSIAGAISYALYKNQKENTDKYVPARLGEINKETEYILNKLNIEKPQLIEDGIDKDLILVDHNETSQSVDEREKGNIIEVLDHHKVDFSYGEPIAFCVKPWGSSCTIIAVKYLMNNLEISEEMATLMLSAILVDTVITKSPTSTEKDLEIIKKLSEIAKIDSWQDFGMEIFKIRSSVSELNDMEVIKSDFKDFEFGSAKFGVGQVETVDLNEFKSREDSILEELNKLREEGGYHTTILFITDILKEGSKFLVSSSDPGRIEKALDTKLKNNKTWLNGVMSRKKQVAPKLTEEFSG